MQYKYCNICNKKGISFVSIEKQLGDELHEHKFPYELSDFETLNYKEYTCSGCGSSDRDRLYALYIDKYLDNQKLSVIDFAPSDTLSSYLSNKSNLLVRTADLYMENVDDKVDITNMNIYKDKTFDFFICSHILEHVSDDNKALSELHRILKKGGSGILMTPIIDKKDVQDEDPAVTDISERWRRFAQDDHVRLYEKTIFLKRIKRAGFIVHEYKRNKLGYIKLKRLGIDTASVLYIVEKK